MALTGQLNDLSLSELIEFFCNQRKTGRLKVDYALAPGVFFIKEGELVDAKIGSLDGAEAIYFALTLPSAAFDFSASIQSSRRTINEPWTRVVLEGLRRIDEGVPPSEQDPFAGLKSEELDNAISQYLNTVEAAEATSAVKEEPAAAKSVTEAATDSLPLSMMVETTNTEGTGRRKFMLAGIAAVVLLACVVASVPLARRLSRSSANATTAPVTAPLAPADANATTNAPAPDASAPTPDTAAAEDAVLAAKREARDREQRLQREREQRKQDEAKKAEQQQLQALAAPTPAPTGPKTVRVSISYDENGHVTSASVVGSSPGAEAYASTAVRIARGRRFPAGQAGSTVVTIPIN
jgi:TonB family protein